MFRKLTIVVVTSESFTFVGVFVSAEVDQQAHCSFRTFLMLELTRIYKFVNGFHII